MAHLESNNMGRPLFSYALITVAASSLGYGVSQETMHTDLTRNTDHIQQVSVQLQAEVQQRREADAQISQQLSELISMQRTTIDQANQLISLIKVQNQILNKP